MLHYIRHKLRLHKVTKPEPHRLTFPELEPHLNDAALQQCRQVTFIIRYRNVFIYMILDMHNIYNFMVGSGICGKGIIQKSARFGMNHSGSENSGIMYREILFNVPDLRCLNNNYFRNFDCLWYSTYSYRLLVCEVTNVALVPILKNLDQFIRRFYHRKYYIHCKK
jgi:hypothetical protein